MKTIKSHDDKITIPPEFEISDQKRKLKITTPWSVQIITRPIKAFNETHRYWFRSKANGDKPYIPEGFIEFDGVRFKVVGDKK